ncbi:ABC transporter substrate-binding protein [Xanthobacter versatilis]|uniref:ABC transporter substrate-binding protein n=1 Tax=Xanthobacter autotrophicus (strain ATCC BAA-1158 / Py2) TaxID=78245 RepID=UPI00372C3088
MPNNGFEGLRFVGYPVFEPLVQWDLGQADKPVGIKPGLASEWKSDPADRKRWIFKLRPGVVFHDGTAFNADAVVWNLQRFFDDKSPQFEPNGAAIVRGRVPVASWEKIDDMTVAIYTAAPLSYFPLQATYLLFASPTAFEKAGRSWSETARAPAGTGPFRITRVRPRTSVELTRNADYWDKGRLAKVDRIVLVPMPEPMTRVAALQSDQVDWIEAPPPDSLASLKGDGFSIVQSSDNPNVWPYLLMAKAPSPFADARVRQAANYAVDRDALARLMGGTAKPAYGYWAKADPNFGASANAYRYDPAKSLSLLKEAGLTPPVKVTVTIPTSGSGMMLPVPLNEMVQQSMAKAGFDVQFKVVEYGEVLVAVRQPPDAPQNKGADGLNIALLNDVPSMYRWFPSASATPKGNNWGHFQSPELDQLAGEVAAEFDQGKAAQKLRRVSELLVDEAPWLYILSDLQPRALSAKVHGLVPAQSWFLDLTTVQAR